MKHNKHIFLLVFLVSANIFSQTEMIKEKRAQIKALKVSYINSELNLTTSEAEKFWPIYNEYEDNQFQIRHKKNKVYKNLLTDDYLNKITEKEASILLSEIENTDEEIFLIRKKLKTNLKNVISSIKILKLKKAEDDFYKKLLQQYKDKK